MGKGFLQVNIFVGDHSLPVQNSKVLVKCKRTNTTYELLTDKSGVTEKLSLDAPDIHYSLDPYSDASEFSVFDVEAYSPGYKKVIVHDVQVFDTEVSILPIQMHPEIIGEPPQDNIDDIYIPADHGVDFTRPRQNHSDTFISAEVVQANEVKIPDYITVHLGSPNAAARNLRLPFADYIKNVASSEIFPTWDEAALYANIYAQISFALNRVYT